jgi:HEAT repeat protein
MSKGRIAVALLLLAVAVGIAWLTYEPSYQGRPLSSWLEDLDPHSPRTKSDAAVEAVRKIGPKALPEIIRLLNTRKSTVTEGKKWLSDHHVLGMSSVEVWEKHVRAVRACVALGRDAKPALSALIALSTDGVDNWVTDEYVIEALGNIGPDAAAPTIDLLTSPNVTVRTSAAYFLGKFRSRAMVVVPPLVNCLHDGDFTVRYKAAESLGKIAEEPAIAIPALVKEYRAETFLSIRCLECLALGEFKQQARSAETPLLAALDSTNQFERVVAAIALARIEPESTSTVEKVMPFLIQALTDLKEMMPMYRQMFRVKALVALGECRGFARPAVPVMMGCLNPTTQSPSVREAATNALKAIDPVAAAKAGVE